MVNVEADALAGPLLARLAHEEGVVYSLAWGDQPALICEHVDWARACGFKVVAAGKGTRYHPTYHQSNARHRVGDPRPVPEDQGPQPHQPKMFNSFIDGTKSGIEMTAVCNATGLVPQIGRPRLPAVVALRAGGGVQAQERGRHAGEEGRDRGGLLALPRRQGCAAHIAMGTYVVIESDSPYAGQCFVEYNCLPDKSGQYAALYRPTHMIGLELGISVASAALQEGADGGADLLQLRRGRDRQARAQKGRGAGRRGRLLRVGQAGAGRRIAQARATCRSALRTTWR